MWPLSSPTAEFLIVWVTAGCFGPTKWLPTDHQLLIFKNPLWHASGRVAREQEDDGRVVLVSSVRGALVLGARRGAGSLSSAF